MRYLIPLLLTLILMSCGPELRPIPEPRSAAWMNSTENKLHYLREEIVHNRQLEDAAPNPTATSKLNQIYPKYNILAREYNEAVAAADIRACKRSCGPLSTLRKSYKMSSAYNICLRSCSPKSYHNSRAYRLYFPITRRPR